MIFLTFIIAILLSLFSTELFRQYSIKKNFLDLPNSRSSHSVATPRGGGVAIFISFFIIISFHNSISTSVFFALLGSGLLVAMIGFWDDQGHIAAKWRLLSHFLAAAWSLIWLNELPESQLLAVNVEWISSVVVAFFLVWLLNLFNFMDGIDGIAASETIFIAAAGGYFFWMSGFESLTFISFTLAASTAGFLILNWPPAKIFMGDVGSGFLGLMLGLIAYISILEGMSFWLWLILFSVFLTDSSVTLIRRILNGDKWYEAHCSHAYQHAARKWSHKKVTVSVIIINLFWLLPLATLSYFKPEFEVLLTLLTFIPLIIVALKLKAGITIINNK